MWDSSMAYVKKNLIKVKLYKKDCGVLAKESI